MHFFNGDFMKISDSVINKLIINSKKAFRRGEIPVSAIILDKNGNIISSSYNKRQRKCNVLGHAEVSCIMKVERKIKDWRLNNYVMIVTLEPCDMCSMIIKECRIDKVYYFLERNDKNKYDFFINKVLIENYDSEKKLFKKLLTSFFDNKR